MTFPLNGLLPKHETQASMFLDSYPQYNGDNVTIAILDTGVDPGSLGLVKCPDGKPKITHIIDCSGSGDVKCGSIVEACSENDSKTVKGLSGKTLTLGNEWENPTGKYHLGLKNCNDLFPNDLMERLKKERRREFEKQLHAHLTEANQLSVQNKDAKDALKDEYKNRIDVLKEQLKSYEDPPVWIDCVWFHNGQLWLVAIDKNQSGDLSKTTLLTEYHLKQQYDCFGTDSLLNFSVNVYDQGQTLSIVTTAGTHGTHVAAIAAAYFENESHLNGVAPGAQIVSLKISDNRLGSMETGRALYRAAIELSRLKVDLANMSFGEASSVANQGRFIELIKENVINQCNTVFVSSAGNAGPALSTVGAPGGTTDGIIGVGAYVHQSMMEAEYAMLENVNETPYTWSSRGPCTDGSVGVSIYAPGAAITSIPQYTLSNSKLMNGTSMSSPNLCGCLALLISGLKASNIDYTPYMIQRAIENSGKDISDPFKVVFIQVDKAFKYLKENSYSNFKLGYSIAVGENARGIYLREYDETHRLGQFGIQIDPIFPHSLDPETNLEKFKMDAKLVLQSTQSWIKTPHNLHLNNGGRSFVAQVDPTLLDQGFHFGQILAFDSNHMESGPLFKIPVTVCKPMEESCFIRLDNQLFTPGKIKRHFVPVPLGVNFAQMTIRSKNRDTNARFYTHLMQLAPQTSYKHLEHDYAFSFNTNGTGLESDVPIAQKSFRVLPGVTLEVCLAQFWSSLNSTNVSVEIKFSGIQITTSGENVKTLSNSFGGSSLLLTSGIHGFTRLDVFNTTRKEDLSFSLSLDTIKRVLRPSNEGLKIAPLASRDILPDSKQCHELVLNYKLTTSDSNTSVSLKCPRFNDVLYDSCFENFCCLIFDGNKKLLSYQDVFPKNIKLKESTFTIKIQITSFNLEWLDKLNGMPLVCELSLSKSLSPSLYSSLSGCLTGNSDLVVKKTSLLKGTRKTFFIGDVNLPKEVVLGDVLLGKLDVLTDSVKLDGPLFTMTYLVPLEFKTKDSKDSKDSKEESEVEKKKKENKTLLDSIRDHQLGLLKSISNQELQKEWLEKLIIEYPNHIPIYHEALSLDLETLQDQAKFKNDSPGLKRHVESILKTSEIILGLLNESEIAKYFGISHDSSKLDTELDTKMNSDKGHLIHAYLAQARAYKELCILEDQNHSNVELFESSLGKCYEWIGEKSALQGAYLSLWVWNQARLGFYGTALKAIHKYLADSTKKNSDELKFVSVFSKLKMEYLIKLNWKVLIQLEERWAHTNVPIEYSLY